jgi:hypothetical protein
MNRRDQILQRLRTEGDALVRNMLDQLSLGRLDAEQLAALEQFADENTDWALKAAIDGWKLEPHAVAGFETLRNRLGQKAKGRSSSSVNIFRAAASIAIIVGLGIGFYFISNKIQKEDRLVINAEQLKSPNEEDFKSKAPALNEERFLETSETPAKKIEILNDPLSKAVTESKQTALPPIIMNEDMNNEESISISSNTFSETFKKNSANSADIVNTDKDHIEPTHAGQLMNQQYNDAVAKYQSHEISEKAVKSTNKVNRSKSLSTPAKAENKFADSLSLTYTKASFPGGKEALNDFVRKERRDCFNTTNKFLISDKPTVKLSAKVSIDGTLTQLLVLKSLTDECDAEAKRIVSKMPRWNPAVKNGKQIVEQVEFEISFE